MRLRTPWGHRVYRGVMRLLTGPVLLWLWWRGFREPGYREALAERLGFVASHPSSLGGLWLHVASVGEAQAALALWPELSSQWGEHAVTWTTQTPAARRLITQRTNGLIPVFFAPLDTVGATQRFLQRTQPRTLLLMERELWPEWLWQCEQQAIDVVVVNARLKADAARRWPYSSAWIQPRIQALQQVLCADETSLQVFEALGLATERIRTTGNLKFDMVPAPQTPPEWRDALHERPVLVAASTHEGDEDAILQAWPQVLAQHPKALLILAPRHPPRFDTVARRLSASGLVLGDTLVRRSAGHAILSSTQVVLLDTMGELAQCYPLARLCLMGGTWADVGGHNALEALAAGCPVLFGPHTQQFPELYAAMARAGAAQAVAGEDIGQQAARVLADPQQVQQMQQAGLAFVASQQGSAARTIQELQHLNSWPIRPMPRIGEGGDVAHSHWFNLAVLPSLPVRAFDPHQYTSPSRTLATGSGRGQAHRVVHEGQNWVLRHYRRGGWVAKFNADRYPAAPTAQSRAMQEFALLRAMQSLGLPVPRPVAAQCARTISWLGAWSRYRADIAVECIDQVCNLAQRLDQTRPPPKAWQAIGRTIALMHHHQIDHTDLNCHNILLSSTEQVWLIDFDKCGRRPGDAWKTSNLQRLLRSLRKEHQRRPHFQWDEADWAHLVNGYQSGPA